MKRTLKLFLVTVICAFHQVSISQELTYFNRYGSTADSLSFIYGIPEGVILGVGYHESAGGKSLVAQKLNNHFGLAGNCREDLTLYKSKYRYFPSVIDSFNGFCEWVACRPFYSTMKGSSSDLDWLLKIRASGYASDKAWANRVHQIIKKTCH